MTQIVMRTWEKNDSKMTPVTCTNVYKKSNMELATMADKAHRQPEDGCWPNLASTSRVNMIHET